MKKRYPRHAKEVHELLGHIDNGQDKEESEPQTNIPPSHAPQEPQREVYVLFVREEEDEQDIVDSTAGGLDTAPLREGQACPSLAPVIISILALSLLLAIGIVTPSQQPEQRAFIRVPAVLLPVKIFRVTELVMATGVKTIPATAAHGILTITNGSVIAQELPAGLIFTGKDEVEVVTNAAVFVPAGSASGYGVAYISAHAVLGGEKGNIPALDIDSVEGSSVYIRNLSAFTGGEDARSVKFATPQDKQAALNLARDSLSSQAAQVRAILENCRESIAYGKALWVIWNCQFAAYPHLPGFHMTGVKLAGKILVVDVVYPTRPRPFPGK